MDQQRIQEIMSGPVAQQLLKRTIARLAYTAKDGTPRVIPIGYHWDGTTISMCTATNAAKTPAIRDRPDVALTIDTDEFPPNVLLIRGRAEIERVDGIPDEYMQANDASYMTEEQRAEWEQGVRALYDAMDVIRVTPTWVKVLDFETTLPSAIEELMQQKSAAPEQ